MATTGTYAWSPTFGELMQMAFRRASSQARGGITAEMLADAKNEANLMLLSWGNEGPNLWTVDLISTSLVADTATYTLSANTIEVLDSYLTTTVSLPGGGTSSTDRMLGGISRTEYASYPAKDTSGPPNAYWFNKQLTPTITLYPVPDDQATYVLNTYVFSITQDVDTTSGAQVELPKIWLDAFVWGLAARMALIYNPEKVQLLEMKAAQSLAEARAQNVEDVGFYIRPGVGAYMR